MEDYKRSLETSQAKVLERDEQISKLNQKLREKEDELANVQINLGTT